jgi:CheY-like chemotaxis protein
MLRLLVVEDDLGTREICTAALRHTGYAVNPADSGSAAVTALSSGAKTHAQLLDLKLGDLTGYDVLRVGHLPPEDRRREAKRFKDRLLKRLSRYFRRLPGRP